MCPYPPMCPVLMIWTWAWTQGGRQPFWGFICRDGKLAQGPGRTQMSCTHMSLGPQGGLWPFWGFICSSAAYSPGCEAHKRRLMGNCQAHAGLGLCAALAVERAFSQLLKGTYCKILQSANMQNTVFHCTSYEGFSGSCRAATTIYFNLGTYTPMS